MNIFKSLFLLLTLLMSDILNADHPQTSEAPADPPFMSYEDIVTFQKPQWVALSPSGAKVAYCVRHGSLKDNRNIDTLYVYDTYKKTQTQIYQSEHIKQVLWGKDNSSLYVLANSEAGYKILLFSGASQKALIESADPIPLIALTHDKTRIYFTKTKSESDEEAKAQIEEGYVYDIDKSIVQFEDNYERKVMDEIWALDLASGKSDLLTHITYDNWLDLYDLITSLQISEDENYLLLNVDQLGRVDLGGVLFRSEVRVWDLIRKEWYEPMKGSIAVEEIPLWLEGGKFIFQQRTFSETSDTSVSFWLFDAQSQTGGRLDWLTIPEEIHTFQWDADNEILYALSSANRYRISLKDKIVDKVEIPKMFPQTPSLNADAHLLGFIAESSNEPPEVALYDFQLKQTAKITNFDKQLDNKAMGKVEKIVINTSSGLVSDGYLVHPVDEVPGKRYPIIIATYGFKGSFIADAEWHSSFPAQTLAGKGYAVLLLNLAKPETGAFVLNNSELAMQLEGWNQLELFEQAIDQLVESGIGDPAKVGIYGWSHGGFVVEFLIAHSKKFHVGCMGEGGDYNPGGFWGAGELGWTSLYDNVFGGPPWGDSLKNYLEFCPFFNVEKIQAPLLLEYATPVNAAARGLELYVPLRYLKIPAELVVYDHEEHNFVQPKARVASMARKVEWFDYWLLNKRNPDPRKAEQYRRWDAMRAEAVMQK